MVKRKDTKRTNKYSKYDNNKYFATSLNYVFSYPIYYINLRNNEKYYFCRNFDGKYINSFGIFNSFNDMINDLQNNFVNLSNFSHCNKYSAIKVNENKIIYHGEELNELEPFDFQKYSDTFEYIFVHAYEYTTDKNIKYISKNIPLDDEDFSKRPTVERKLYFSKDKVTTAIDVDAVNEEIRIKNFTNINIYRAFGVNEKPSWKDYMEFLEERCVPRTRYNIKEILRDLNVECYDPDEIIKKTHAKSADDKDWILAEKELTL